MTSRYDVQSGISLSSKLNDQTTLLPQSHGTILYIQWILDFTILSVSGKNIVKSRIL